MIIFSFILLIILIIVVINSKNSLEKKIGNLGVQIDQLKKLLKDAGAGVHDNPVEDPWLEKPIPPTESVEVKIPQNDTATDYLLIETEEEEVKEEALIGQFPSMAAITEGPETEAVFEKERKPGFFERNDWEKFIGENLMNKIGIGILVLGIGFFVKYAIDQDWINEIGRVFIGVLCGGILVVFAHRTKDKFKAFSSVLVGGGMAIFYFSIAIAFHEYALLSQTAAFVIMVIITGFSVLLSIVYDRKELAVLAIIGGFSSPFMVSTGAGNYIVLFSYILILNIGMLILAYFKKWNLLNIISYAFTVILYGGWLISELLTYDKAPYTGALIFASLFYAVFFLMNILYNIKSFRKFKALEISMLLSNTFLYYAAGMLILQNVQAGVFQGLFTALLGAFNLAFALTLYKTKRADLNVLYLLIGLVLTFGSLAAPVQLEGNYITMFWALEAVLLLWLSQKSGMQVIRLASVIVTGLMVISLVMDWEAIYSHSPALNIIFNKAFITSFVSLAAIALTMLLLRKEETVKLYGIDISFYKPILITSFVVFVYISLLLELNYHLNVRIELPSFRAVIIGSYNLLFILCLSLILNRKGNMSYSLGAIILSIFGTIAYITYYHSQIIVVRNEYLEGVLCTLGDHLYHYIPAALAIALLIIALVNTQKIFGMNSRQGKFFIWYFAFAALFIASAELDHLILMINAGSEIDIYGIISQNHKIGYPILWGVGSFLLMFVGMRKKIKELRIISLCVFFITLLKLFIFDIRGISEGGKIAAFICLGVLLLVVSFMYQKLKSLILENEVNVTDKI